jgi:ornithine carbamoyltransferase
MAERWALGTREFLPSLQGRKIAFLGDTACNMANSWLLGAGHFGMQVALSGPPEFAPTAQIKTLLGEEGYTGHYEFTTDPKAAVKDADVVYTDVWVSMGKEEESKARLARMAPYQVTAELMSLAKPDAFFMHCLPAHGGEEVTQEVLDSPRSIIFDQAENRLHVQKAIMAVLAQTVRA